MPTEPRRSLVLVGHPNVGKSVLFQGLTGRYVTVSNYPGTTVDLLSGTVRSLPDTCVVDSPGVVGFPATSEDERVVSRLLVDDEPHSLVQVGDAKSLRRTLLLTAHLAEFGLPLTLVLNMADEAERAGVRVDRDRLSGLLGVPVLATVAPAGTGVGAVAPAAANAEVVVPLVAYPAPVEELLETVTEESGDPRARGACLLWLEGDPVAAEWLAEHLAPRRLELLRAEVEDAVGEPLRATLQEARLEWADAVTDAVVVQEDDARTETLTARLARLSTHRLWGWPVLAVVLYGIYWFVGSVGAGTLVGLLENGLFGEHVNPWVTRVVEGSVPSDLGSDLLVGPYGLWTLGMTYALALILPIVTTFFLAFSVLEDSGYLPRLAAVSNGLFRRLGMNGRAVLPMVLGLGCVTMATMTTRILESKRERVLATLLLALGVPCSAQLGVVLGMLAPISLGATLIWGGVVAGVVYTVGLLAARLVPGERSPLLVELPPLRTPRIGNVLTKTLVRLEWYLREVVPLFLAGTALLFALDRIGALPALIDAMQPLVTGWLGLPPAASAAFLIGFLRRDFGATGLFILHANGELSVEQTLVAMVTITLFIPCVASILMIVRERGAATAAGMVALIFPLAFLVGGVLHRVLLLTGWGA